MKNPVELVSIWDRPRANEIYMIAGWHQWADAGSISSGLPQYLIQLTNAHKIGEIRSDDFYLFQIPGTHHLLRPEIKFEDGFRTELRPRVNEFYYAETPQNGLIIFIGEEPHIDINRYASAFFELSAPHWWDPLIFTCVALLGSAVITWLKPVVGRMLAPVYAYAAVIMLMLIGGLNALNHVDDRLLCWSVVAGACLFVVSDLFVARQRFVRPGRINPMIGLPLYYISQFILAMTPAFYTR